MRRCNSIWAVGLLWLSTPACATDALTPPTAPTEAAVALLADVRNPTTTDAMLRNLATLARTCDWARRYDVIVFHDNALGLNQDLGNVGVGPLPATLSDWRLGEGLQAILCLFRIARYGEKTP